jgi:hypothetical protein
MKYLSFLILFLGLTSLQAQETTPASGGDVSGSGGSISYTVGQLVYTTLTGTTGSAAQGVQQPFEIYVVTGIENSSITLVCSVYPNPTNDFIILQVEGFNKNDLSYHLCDMNGKVFEIKTIESIETKINMSNYTPATYILKVTDNDKEVKIFKIVKK